MDNETRGPSPFTVERVVSAWQRAQAELASDPMLTTDENAIQSAMGEVVIDPASVVEVDADRVLQRITRAMVFAKARGAEARDMELAMKARKQRYQQREEMLRHELLEVLRALSRRSFAAIEGTATVVNVAASLVITDAEAIPDEYVTTRTEVIRTPDKAAIEADIAEGVVIAGCSMSNPGVTLSFRQARAPKQEAA